MEVNCYNMNTTYGVKEVCDCPKCYFITEVTFLSGEIKKSILCGNCGKLFQAVAMPF